MRLKVFYVVVKVLLEKEIFKNLSRFMSAIKENKYKHPNICNTLCTLCKNMITLFILTILYTNPIHKHTFSGFVLPKIKKKTNSKYISPLSTES